MLGLCEVGESTVEGTYELEEDGEHSLPVVQVVDIAGCVGHRFSQCSLYAKEEVGPEWNELPTFALPLSLLIFYTLVGLDLYIEWKLSKCTPDRRPFVSPTVPTSVQL